MRKLNLIKTVFLLVVISFLSSCGLNVKSDSSVKKFLCKHAFSLWIDNDELKGAVTTITFSDDNTFSLNLAGKICKGEWRIKEVDDFKKSRIIELHYTSGDFAGQSINADLMESKVLNIGGDGVYHIDSRY